jgi:hypothetical protein
MAGIRSVEEVYYPVGVDGAQAIAAAHCKADLSFGGPRKDLDSRLPVQNEEDPAANWGQLRQGCSLIADFERGHPLK